MSTEQNITIEQSAVDRVIWMREHENYDSKTFLRIAIVGGGCSGFQYDMRLTKMIHDDDQLYGEAIIIDEASREIMKDTIITFENDLNGAQFVINNPNTKSGCGCGKSFTMNDEEK